MVTVKTWVYDERVDAEYEVVAKGTVIPADPGQIMGPVEACWPPTDAEVSYDDIIVQAPWGAHAHYLPEDYAERFGHYLPEDYAERFGDMALDLLDTLMVDKHEREYED